MRRWLIAGSLAFIVLVSATVALAYYQGRGEDTGEVVDWRGRSHVSVVLTDKGFEPQAIRITQGTVVTFTTTRGDEFWPASDPHPTHTDYPAFDPKQPVEPNASWSFTFDRVGRWGYHDHIRSYFTGTVYVDPQP